MLGAGLGLGAGVGRVEVGVSVVVAGLRALGLRREGVGGWAVTGEMGAWAAAREGGGAKGRVRPKVKPRVRREALHDCLVNKDLKKLGN